MLLIGHRPEFNININNRDEDEDDNHQGTALKAASV
jgi:hypothetical protein